MASSQGCKCSCRTNVRLQAPAGSSSSPLGRRKQLVVRAKLAHSFSTPLLTPLLVRPKKTACDVVLFTYEPSVEQRVYVGLPRASSRAVRRRGCTPSLALKLVTKGGVSCKNAMCSVRSGSPPSVRWGFIPRCTIGRCSITARHNRSSSSPAEGRPWAVLKLT